MDISLFDHMPLVFDCDPAFFAKFEEFYCFKSNLLAPDSMQRLQCIFDMQIRKIVKDSISNMNSSTSFCCSDEIQTSCLQEFKYKTIVDCENVIFWFWFGFWLIFSWLLHSFHVWLAFFIIPLILGIFRMFISISLN